MKHLPIKTGAKWYYFKVKVKKKKKRENLAKKQATQKDESYKVFWRYIWRASSPVIWFEIFVWRRAWWLSAGK